MWWVVELVLVLVVAGKAGWSVCMKVVGYGLGADGCKSVGHGGGGRSVYGRTVLVVWVLLYMYIVWIRWGLVVY